MKKTLLFAVICFLYFSNSSFSQVTDADFLKLSWLEGSWARTNAKPGRGGNERWVKNSTTTLQGYGVNMNGADTAFVEKLKIISKERKIFYVADVPENKEPVLFLFTTITDHSFVCENLQHDFPKRISYEKDGDQLKAVISGNGKSIDYLFKKTKE
jgi:hypothetical protein